MDCARYFDNAASTPVDDRVVEAMVPWLGSCFGNPSSIHSWGRQAADAVENARRQVAALLGVNPEEIIFTAGATEGNNWIARLHQNWAASPFEHASMNACACSLDGQILPCDGWNLLPPEHEVDLVSVIAVNSETGAIPSLPDTRAKVHRDITQACGKIPYSVEGIDYATFSAHKFHGPKGIGGLYVQGGDKLDPMLYGGLHEGGQRAGTLNVAGIVGMGRAAELCMEHMGEGELKARELRGIVLEQLHGLTDWGIHEHSAQSPFVLSIGFAGLLGEILLVELDARGFAVSSGSACSSKGGGPTRVLAAAGCQEELIPGTIRVSFGRRNTEESAAALGKAIHDIVSALRGLKTGAPAAQST